jgi:hypothetical protein
LQDADQAGENGCALNAHSPLNFINVKVVQSSIEPDIID